MEQTTPITQKRIVIALIFALGIVVILTIILTPLYGSYSIHKTPFKRTMLPTIQNDSIYGYSGTAFYKSNLNSKDDITILSKGFRLPEIETSHWIGDEGIILTFANTGYIKSRVEEVLNSRGEQWDDKTQNYVWYLDFKTSKLYLINRYGIVGDTVYYSKKQQGVYYVGYSDTLNEEEQETAAPLQFFSLPTHTSTIVRTNIASPVNLKYIGQCPSGFNYVVCTVEGSDGEYTLNQISSSEKSQILDKKFSTVSPTANPDIFIGTINNTVNVNRQEDSELKADIYRIDIKTNTVKRLSTTISASRSVLANTTNDEKFYVFEPSIGSEPDRIGYLSGSKNILGMYKTKVKTATTDSKSKSFLEPFSRNSQGFSLYSDVMNSTYLISPSQATYTQSSLVEDSVKSLLAPCFTSSTEGFLYTPELKQFRVNITYNDLFTAKIADFTDCALKTSPKSALGYTYIFVGVSPEDGRLVTD